MQWSRDSSYKIQGDIANMMWHLHKGNIHPKDTANKIRLQTEHHSVQPSIRRKFGIRRQLMADPVETAQNTPDWSHCVRGCSSQTAQPLAPLQPARYSP